MSYDEEKSMCVMNSRDRLKQLSSVYRLYVSSVASQLKNRTAPAMSG
jgi:hypothetical protein